MTVEINRSGRGVEVRWAGRSVTVGLSEDEVGVPVRFSPSGNEIEVSRSRSPFAAGCWVVAVSGWAHVDPGSRDDSYASARGEVVYRSVRAPVALDRASVVALIARLAASLEDHPTDIDHETTAHVDAEDSADIEVGVESVAGDGEWGGSWPA